jgi:hypothetical protein
MHQVHSNITVNLPAQCITSSSGSGSNTSSTCVTTVSTAHAQCPLPGAMSPTCKLHRHAQIAGTDKATVLMLLQVHGQPKAQAAAAQWRAGEWRMAHQEVSCWSEWLPGNHL